MPNGLAGSAQVSYPLLAPSGTAGAPSYSFAAESTLGFYRQAAGVVGLSGYFIVSGYIASSIAFVGSSDSAFFSLGAANDVTLYRDAADVLAQRRAANAQTFRLYQSFTDSGNYTRVNLGWDGAGFLLGLTAAGTGNPNQSIRINANQAFLSIGPSGGFIFGSDALNWWNINSSGNLLPVADNTYNIGDPGARVGTVTGVYGNFAGYAAGGQLRVVGIGGIYPGAASGVLVLINATEDDFARLCFGGTTAAFPSIKRDGANLALVHADGSAGYIDLTVHDVIGSSVYLSNLVGVGANNTNIGLSLTGFAMNIHNSSASLTLAVTGGATLATFAGTGYLEMYEVTAPSAPAANSGRIYFEDNGAGKTRLMCLFASGSAQQLAIEP